MSDKIHIDVLDLVERVLIPMQNLSSTLRYIVDGETLLSHEALFRGLSKAQVNAETVSLYVLDLKNDEPSQRTLKLPALIKQMVREATILQTAHTLTDADSEVQPAKSGDLKPLQTTL
jgi:hypothetical protein